MLPRRKLPPRCLKAGMPWHMLLMAERSRPLAGWNMVEVITHSDGGRTSQRAGSAPAAKQIDPNAYHLIS